jgi:hypothetical protein
MFLKDGFADLAKELEEHGYTYSKAARAFPPARREMKR